MWCQVTETNKAHAGAMHGAMYLCTALDLLHARRHMGRRIFTSVPILAQEARAPFSREYCKLLFLTSLHLCNNVESMKVCPRNILSLTRTCLSQTGTSSCLILQSCKTPMVLAKEVMNSDGHVIFERRTLDKANLFVLTKKTENTYM